MSVLFSDIASPEHIVAMVPYRGTIIVAPAHQLFQIKDGKLQEMRFDYADPMDEPFTETAKSDDEIPF